MRRARSRRRGGARAGPRAGTSPRPLMPRAVPPAGGRQGERPRVGVRGARGDWRRAPGGCLAHRAFGFAGAVQGAAGKDGGAGVCAVRAERAGRRDGPARARAAAGERGVRRARRVGRQGRAVDEGSARAVESGGGGGTRRRAHPRGPGCAAAVPRVYTRRGRRGRVQGGGAARAVHRG